MPLTVRGVSINQLRKREKGSHQIICTCATPHIDIVIIREKEEEEETPTHYYGKGRVGTTVNDEIL